MKNNIQNCFCTGELAKMFNLNKQTLFYYDKEGIFQPECRNPNNGYRMYKFNQIYRLALICYLRKIGFSIDQIRDYLNDSSVESNARILRKKSEDIRKNYQEFLKLDDIIQRKLLFVQRKLAELSIGEVQIKQHPRCAYIPLGQEVSIYNKEVFYSYPTIAFYQYDTKADQYEVTFGAYLESEYGIGGEDLDKVRYISEHWVLSYCWKGKYSGIEQKVRELHKEYNHLSLSANSYNFNIIDQFLEKDENQYVTEIQIPILDESFPVQKM